MNYLKLIIKEQEGNPNFLTIGECYSKMIDKLWELSDLETNINKKAGKDEVKLFSGDISQQFTYVFLENMTHIIDVRTCLDQFRLIVEEGEGSSLFKLTG